MVRTRRIPSSSLGAPAHRLPRAAAAAATCPVILLSTVLLLGSLHVVTVSAYSGRNKAMIVPDPSNGWKAIEIVTEGDKIDINNKITGGGK